MIAVISDLHFEEEASDMISGDGKKIIFRRNLDPKAYRSFIAHMAEEARRRRSEIFNLVIAGELFDDPDALVRHGHEYDNNNFALDLPSTGSIPLEIEEAGYSQANFGDFITIDIAVRLPYLFRKRYGDEQILKDPILEALYLHLLKFDDVRPQSALLDYMLDDSKRNFSAEQGWEKLV